MRKMSLVVAVVLFGTVAPLFAQDAPDGALHGDVGVTYNSMHVWRGYMTFGQHSSIQTFVNLDLMGTGFGIGVMENRANASGTNPDMLGYNNEKRWDYTLHYAGALEAGQPCETRYMVGYRYFNYPSMSSHTAFSSYDKPGSIDLQELFAGVAFPNLLGVPGLVPGYAVVKGWPSNSDTIVGGANPRDGTYAGWAHIFMLDYGWKVQGFTAETPEQIINFHIETVFNDGVDPRPYGGYTDSDWTHVLLGVSTDFNLGSGLIFTPALYHQVTMEDDSLTGVSPDHDITWASMTLKYKF